MADNTPPTQKKSKKLPIVVAIVVGLLGIGVLGVIIFRPEPKVSESTQAQTPGNAKSYVVKKACDVLPQDVAKNLLGGSGMSVSLDDSSNEAPSDDLVVSTCSYTARSTSIPPVTKSATLLVRSAKNQTGQASNEQQFIQKRPANTQDVEGYGDRAYWNLQLGQLNILKGNTWYIASFGSPVISQRSLAETETMAKAIASRLDYASGQGY